ncbi:ABC transporter permease [Paraburkholderia sprentiae WSM5005]|uniref:ABC transporter permease n=1 Tax=Paraburkholderia sprentiae WSM5005 TaxID=754502 RepID=A0A8F4KJU6_9BURK|nr:ABC transporter permease [Paraburkholderia sprentiae]QXE07296.1 ABC transporter permease [Paraburkholderia sprentiae WSM5005]
MDTLVFIWSNAASIASMLVDHVLIVLTGVGCAIVTGVALGIVITLNDRLAKVVLYTAAMLMTIPSIALFGMLIPVLSLIGQGIGFLPAAIALFVYSQLPIVRNTYVAIRNLDPALREAANGMGMTAWQRLYRVEMPIAVPIIMAGVRMAVVMNIGIAAIATYIGAGGLGRLISRGISQSDPRQLIAGAVIVALLAILADLGLSALQWRLTPEGMRPRRTRFLRRRTAIQAPLPAPITSTATSTAEGR